MLLFLFQARWKLFQESTLNLNTIRLTWKLYYLMKSKCLECGDEFLGRVDKKFCSDQCRNTFNNRLNSDANNYVRNINHILRKNRKILEDLNLKEKTKVHKSQLASKGFNFNYFTNIYKTKTEKEYFFCYDMGYLPIEDDFFMLVVRKEYVN